MASRKPYKVMDRTRRVKKGVMASSLEELTLSSRRKLAYSGDKEVMVVLEEDGTEVDEEDYFQTLEPNMSDASPPGGEMVTILSGLGGCH